MQNFTHRNANLNEIGNSYTKFTFESYEPLESENTHIQNYNTFCNFLLETDQIIINQSLQNFHPNCSALLASVTG
jgi:hypothetical protein